MHERGTGHQENVARSESRRPALHCLNKAWHLVLRSAPHIAMLFASSPALSWCSELCRASRNAADGGSGEARSRAADNCNAESGARGALPAVPCPLLLLHLVSFCCHLGGAAASAGPVPLVGRCLTAAACNSGRHCVCCRQRSDTQQTLKRKKQQRKHAWGSGCGMQRPATSTMQYTDGTTTLSRVSGPRKRRPGGSRVRQWQRRSPRQQPGARSTLLVHQHLCLTRPWRVNLAVELALKRAGAPGMCDRAGMPVQVPTCRFFCCAVQRVFVPCLQACTMAVIPLSGQTSPACPEKHGTKSSTSRSPPLEEQQQRAGGQQRGPNNTRWQAVEW